MSARSAVHGALALTCVRSARLSPWPIRPGSRRPTRRSGRSPAAATSGSRPRRARPTRCAAIREARLGPGEKRPSLAFFGQLTDPQIADEMSPGAGRLPRSRGQAICSSWRPQEALGLQVFDQTVATSTPTGRARSAGQAAKQAKLGFAITTGDLADNQQLNETRWFKTVLDGGRSIRSRASRQRDEPVRARRPTTVAALNAAVAARQYTGVADYDDYRGVPADRFAGFWDPDEAAPRRRPVRGLPALSRAARARAEARSPPQGLKVPWYIARGNHDGLVQGNAPASTDLFRSIADGLPEGLPVRRARPGAVRQRRRGRGVPPDRRPVVHPDAAGRRAQRPAGPGSPDPLDHRVQEPRSAARTATATSTRPRSRPPRRRDLLRLPPAQGHRADLARHGRRGRRLDRQPRRPAVPVAREDAEGGGEGQPARDRLRPPHAGDDEQHAHATSSRARARRPKPGCDADPRKSTPLHRGTRGPRPCATCSCSTRT